MVDQTMKEFDPDDPIFLDAFWDWFDSLDSKQKDRFWNFSLDMSTLYFYNQIYRYKINNDEKVINFI